MALLIQARRNRLRALYAVAAAQRNIFVDPLGSAGVRRRPVFRSSRSA